jgi:SAM-dependent methyltransferase
VVIVGTICAALITITVIDAIAGGVVVPVITGLIAAWLLLTVVSYAFTTRVGKFAVWARILGELGLRGDEDLLDLGCGRGAVLLAAAKLLPEGHAVGIDLWRADQTGNSPEATRRNAELEGVSARVTVHTGDITSLPFTDRSFDVVVSSFVIHNIPTGAATRRADPHRRPRAHQRVPRPAVLSRPGRRPAPQPRLAGLVGRPLVPQPPGHGPAEQ